MIKRSKKCPICKKAVDWNNNPFKPFCSERCKMIDLGSWADERYRIADEKADENNTNLIKSNESGQKH